MSSQKIVALITVPDAPAPESKDGMYQNVRAVSGSAAGDASGKLKGFLEQAVADSNPTRFLLEDASVDYLATEIGLRIFQFIMRDALDMGISMSVSAIGMDSLMAIRLRRWWKQSFAIDVTVLEIMAAGTLRQLGRLASEGLGKRMAET